jgi:hypothetical protein
MRQLAVFSLILLTFGQNAWAICKLNVQGHNICTNEKALLRLSKSTNKNEGEISDKFASVKVVRHVLRERNVLVKSKELGERQVHIDELVGNKLCADDDQVCKGIKVVMREDCSHSSRKPVLKIVESFENQVHEVATTQLFGNKTFLTTETCIDPVN